MGATAEGFIGKNLAEGVRLANGETLPADVIIVGVGIIPATVYIKGIPLEEDGGVRVDAHMCISENVYAAGDSVRFPYRGKEIRIEHWRTAGQMGRVAAHNMAGRSATIDAVPFFWSEQPGMELRYVGYADRWDEIFLKGDVSSKSFVAFYASKNIVHAACGSNNDSTMAAIEELMRHNTMPTLDVIRRTDIDFGKLLLQ